MGSEGTWIDHQPPHNNPRSVRRPERYMSREAYEEDWAAAMEFASPALDCRICPARSSCGCPPTRPHLQAKQQVSERQRDSFMVPHVFYALRHYNARHPGAVKPLMHCRVVFRGHPWFHVNFWARSRSTNKMSRFFAEVHYKPPPLSSFAGSAIPAPIPTVDT